MIALDASFWDKAAPLGEGATIAIILFFGFMYFQSKTKDELPVIVGAKTTNGNVASAMSERRLKELEDQVRELEHQRHSIIMPILRWHDNEIHGLGGERSKTLSS